VKTIGLLGGMSWVSTQMYYELLNKEASRRRGPGYQPPILLKSFDYRAFFELQQSGRDHEVGAELARGARDLASIGADVIAICANTMHKHFDEVQAAVEIPILHVADACGEAIAKSGFTSATLLGTKYTMEGEFYRKRLADRHGVETSIPDEVERDDIERVIRTELTRCILTSDSRHRYLEIIAKSASQGSQCTILGCTEIGLLVQQKDTPHPLFDTTILHAEALLDWACA